MTDQSITTVYRHNPNARNALSLEYDTTRPRYIRLHNSMLHEFGHGPVLHIPADLEGVVP